jgi:hypothetical protein
VVRSLASRPDFWLAVEPAHLPEYSHRAVIVGTVIILATIVLAAGADEYGVWSKRR